MLCCVRCEQECLASQLRPATVLISVEGTARDIQDLDSLAVVGFCGERQNKKQDVAAISGR